MLIRLPCVMALLCFPALAFADTCFEERVSGGEAGRTRLACFSAQRARFDMLGLGVIVDMTTKQYIVLDHQSAQYTSVPHQPGPSLKSADLSMPQRFVTQERKSIAGFDAVKVEWRLEGKTAGIGYYTKDPPLADALALKKTLAAGGDMIPWPELGEELGFPVRLERGGQVIELVRVNSSPPPDTFDTPRTYTASPAALQRLRRLLSP